ncbi:MAG TPA: Imm26 family immunity protein [Opitutaceae bacterium]|jgi:hypothetical protein|nr:Imm26 family immunity protein [Opitutaceae bacterium]
MAKRVSLIIGDLFAVPLGEGLLAVFQYVADDLTQLNSAVIRVFKRRYQERLVDINSISSSEETEFHAHVFLRLGLKLGFWKKIGHAKVDRNAVVWFRDSNDYGNPNILVSKNWHVWQINCPFTSVGTLHGEQQEYEIGIVISPDSIVWRIKTGHYDFIYPQF